MDPILSWNDVALEANRRSHTNDAEEQTGPPLRVRALAMVHLAMYDAYAGVCGNRSKLPLYLPDLPSAPAIASASAAVAGAAHATLSPLFPSQKAAFDLKLAQAGLTGTPVEVSEGKGFGTKVAQALLRDRNGDPGVGDSGYTPSTARGGHGVDPSNPGQGYHAPFFGVMTKGFAVATRHALDKPPALDDNHYRKALRQVRGKGSPTSSWGRFLTAYRSARSTRRSSACTGPMTGPSTSAPHLGFTTRSSVRLPWRRATPWRKKPACSLW